ncbi:anthranilate synthase component I [Paenactinomyces guangxiensis]|uniref:Anthranilate synthase component 1 n=1 Tax=Paenactinomyces guangxiensis TaxID=1490290 RepID=A0A7W1WU90_9BACL|nr:anthranilate synthase component I [Paenactinomyces guangxiensis]MBA4496047.1 anthranilate synthase component I [Paenactinomyces guangxiensis]MBH8593135.1 anthranilate synthase component I [Paenactinomyces guangxiensis]
MIYPCFEEVRTFAHTFSTIPICKSVHADTETPIGLYHRLADDPYSFLLESVEGGEKWSRYSFMGSKPFQVITGKDGSYTLTDQQGSRPVTAADPAVLLKDHLNAFHSPSYDEYPPFLGGAVGYFSYEAVRYFEPNSPVTQAGRGTGAYDVHLMFYDRLLIFDHLKQKIILVAHLFVPENYDDRQLRELYMKALSDLEEWERELYTRPVSIPQLPSLDREVVFDCAYSNLTRHEYMELVERAKEYIRAGDIFQVVPSQRWEYRNAPAPMNVYRILRVLNPSPYMYYLRMGEETIVGTSPELLVRVDGKRVDTRPIAGSRPRGKNAQEDEEMVRDLYRDEKEKAEHIMLVDLGRNDVGRVARYGTVEVTQQMKIEKYSHIMHLVSNVTGELVDSYHALDAFRACFPAGTVSGAPKIRAMEIIAELEPEPRGIYAGAIGYFSFTGQLDTCIAIRTIYFRGNCAYVQAGGGVVADSVPDNEYIESVNKAKGMLKALQLAGEKMVEGCL